MGFVEGQDTLSFHFNEPFRLGPLQELRFYFDLHGRAFGMAAVTSTSRNMPPSISPSRTHLSACHQSS